MCSYVFGSTNGAKRKIISRHKKDSGGKASKMYIGSEEGAIYTRYKVKVNCYRTVFCFTFDLNVTSSPKNKKN